MTAFYVAVFCEESQTLTNILREYGLKGFSFDLKPCSGGHPEWHVQGDCLPYLNGRCSFTTMDGERHHVPGRWDLIVCHPECTYLTFCANRSFVVKPDGSNAQKVRDRWKKRYEAAKFFMRFVDADCEHICVENPVGFMNSFLRKADQTIQPWQFGDKLQKRTCYWLKGLPKLVPSVLEEPEMEFYWRWSSEGRWRRDPKWFRDAAKASNPAEVRSKSFPGVARAMAQQWGLVLAQNKATATSSSTHLRRSVRLQNKRKH